MAFPTNLMAFPQVHPALWEGYSQMGELFGNPTPLHGNKLPVGMVRYVWNRQLINGTANDPSQIKGKI